MYFKQSLAGESLSLRRVQIVINLIVKVDVATGADICSINARGHANAITEFVVHCKMQSPSDCLALVYSQGFVV